MSIVTDLNDVRLNDFEAFSDLFTRNWKELAGLRLTGRAENFSSTAGRIKTSGVILVDVVGRGYEADFSDSRYLTIVLPVASSFTTRFGNTHARVEPGCVFRSDGLPYSFSYSSEGGGVRARHFAFERDALRRYAEIYEGCNVRLDFGTAEVAPADQSGGLPDEVDCVDREAAAGLFASLTPSRAGLFEDRMIRALLESPLGRRMLRSAPVRPSQPGRKRLALAVDYIQAHHAQALRMQDIAGAAGVGMRSLQIAFRRAFGMTPWQYLTARRLDAARQRLANHDDASVTAVALDTGFAHLGDFSRQYRLRFGERPSETFRRARGR